jgi:hypothetical protein
MAGVAVGRWRVVSEDWPIVVFAISAAPRTGAPEEFFLRSDLAGYPFVGPTSAPWNIDRGRLLAPQERPKGERVGHVFRPDWESGRVLYAPFDRVALDAHPNWKLEYPRYIWTCDRDITWYLSTLSDLLNDADYTGV